MSQRGAYSSKLLERVINSGTPAKMAVCSSLKPKSSIHASCRPP
jgi:hypothetical protein